jgi:hypothetical protein
MKKRAEKDFSQVSLTFGSASSRESHQGRARLSRCHGTASPAVVGSRSSVSLRPRHWVASSTEDGCASRQPVSGKHTAGREHFACLG